MPVEFQFSDDDIAFAESVLLPAGANFDEERRRFIKCLDTADLQAVPGSGKTTALLAKLVILERHLSLPGSKGVLVISHTNAAVNEIRNRIGRICPNLFRYPNFVGTIQSFVDTFLAIPCFTHFYRFRPSQINNDSYRIRAEQFKRVNLEGYNKAEQKNAKYYLMNNDICATFRLSLINGKGVPVKNIASDPIKIQKPRPESDGYIDWNDQEKDRIISWLIDYKKLIMNDGVLCYDDAYFFADLALERFSQVANLIRKRFNYIFVDEMQDMAPHQNKLLEKLFFNGTQTNCVFQRIGDPDQAIFGGKDFINIEGWNIRPKTLSLNKSMRLPPTVAAILTPFAYEKDDKFEIIGLQNSKILPHLLIYDDESIGNVIEQYAKIIEFNKSEGNIPENSSGRFTAVAWNSTWDENIVPELGKHRLINLCPTYQNSILRNREEFDTLADYLYSIDPEDRTLRSARAGILKAACRALRLGDAVNPQTNRQFTPTSLIDYIRLEDSENNYHQINRLLLKWSLKLVEGKTDTVLRILRNVIPILVNKLRGSPDNSADFLNNDQTVMNEVSHEKNKSPNSLTFGNIHIGLGTVHSVKGQTHTATLYFESAYYNDGGKMYESQRLADQFKGKRLNSKAGKRIKESARMVYVGFSRPTHLLVFAVHKTNFDSCLSDIDTTRWKVIRVTNDDSIQEQHH